MEVHHHSHIPTSREKKWTHYFWEFFMLFLAVTLGFLVENQREHYIEHRQEKQYMKLMMEDLITDTIQLQKSLAEIGYSLSNIDSTILQLVNGNTANKTTTDAYRFSSVALKRIPVVFTDRTLTQLKNSGRMRIVRSQKVMDALTHYWNHIEVIRITLDRHAHYRSMGRDLEIRIFNLAKDFLKDHEFMTRPSGQMDLISGNTGLITEYANTLAYCGVVLKQGSVELREQYRLATALINLIHKEYRVKLT
jgi:hypothetical protein